MTTDKELMSSLSYVYIDDARDDLWNIIPNKKMVVGVDHGYDHENVEVTIDEAIRFVELSIESDRELLILLKEMKEKVN